MYKRPLLRLLWVPIPSHLDAGWDDFMGRERQRGRGGGGREGKQGGEERKRGKGRGRRRERVEGGVEREGEERKGGTQGVAGCRGGRRGRRRRGEAGNLILEIPNSILCSEYCNTLSFTCS